MLEALRVVYAPFATLLIVFTFEPPMNAEFEEYDILKFGTPMFIALLVNVIPILDPVRDIDPAFELPIPITSGHMFIPKLEPRMSIHLLKVILVPLEKDSSTTSLDIARLPLLFLKKILLLKMNSASGVVKSILAPRLISAFDVFKVKFSELRVRFLLFKLVYTSLFDFSETRISFIFV
jgi:hypothetical protein